MVNLLLEGPLCNSLTDKNREEIMSHPLTRVRTFKKGESIVYQGDRCNHLHLLIEGEVKGEMTTDSGDQLIIEIIKAPGPLAPAFLFAENNTFPVTAIAMEMSRLISIPKELVVKLLQENLHFLREYISYNSDKTQFLSNKLQLLSIKTIKGKLAHYLLEQLSLCHSISPAINTFLLEKNRTQLAQFFGVSRPALARIFSEIQQEGAIEAKRNEITILNRNLLEEMLVD